MTRRPQATIGRHELSRVPGPPGGYPSDVPASLRNSRAALTPVVVVDVYDARRRHRALARLDLLDRERRARRIDEAAYLVGREVEAVFEAMSRIGGGGQWLDGERIDAASQAELAIVLGAERATIVNAFLRWLVGHIGRADTRLLWMILGQRISFAVAAEAFGRAGARGLHYTIDRFRDALAALAQAKAAKGRKLLDTGRLR